MIKVQIYLIKLSILLVFLLKGIFTVIREVNYYIAGLNVL